MIIHNDYYVAFIVAKLLKKAGFNWKCKFCFSELINAGKDADQHLLDAGIFDDETNKVYGVFDNPTEDDILRPTLEIAQKWLRDVKRIFVCVVPDIKDYHATWIFYICNLQGLFYEYDDCFLTYEEALETGIEIALKLILDKKYDL